MPFYKFRCPTCNKEMEEYLKVESTDFPICCERMKRVIEPSRFSFSCPPAGRLYPTIDEVCSSDQEYQRKADALKYRLDKENKTV